MQEEEWDSFPTHATPTMAHAAHPVTTKVPPGYDGSTNWFRYADAVEEWCDLTKVEAKRRGPAIAARLSGRAEIYKERLDRERLRDPETGVEYLLATLRPFFVKDLQSVFLYRFFQLLRCNRGQTDHQRWMIKYEIARQKAVDAWLEATTPRPAADRADVAARIDHLRDAARDRQRLEVRRDWVGPPAELAAAVNAVARPEATEAMRHSAIEHVWRVQRRARADLFPISDNLSALMALVMADLSESQRETLMNLIYQRNVELTALTLQQLRDFLITLFHAPKSSLENPSWSQRTGPRSFVSISYGELDQYEGHWVCDETTGDEGFLDEHEDICWMYDEDQCYWMTSRMVRRPWRERSAEFGSHMVPFLMSLPQMKNLGVSLDLRGTPEKILFHTGFLKGQGVPLHRNRAGHLTLDVNEICRKARLSAERGRQPHAASSFPAVPDEPSAIPVRDPLQPIAAEPAIPPPAVEKKYRLPAGQKVPPAHLHQRTAERKFPEVRGPEEQGAEPAAVPPPVHSEPAKGAPEPPLPPEGDEGEALPQRVLNLDGLIPPPLVKLHQRLSKRTELLKLHLKHYHMSSAQFRRRTSELCLPEGIYRLYENVVKECETCQKTKPAPPRSRFSGVRAKEFGDVVFMDHCEIKHMSKKHQLFLVLDGATSLLWGSTQQEGTEPVTQDLFRDWMHIHSCKPKWVVADMAFFTPSWMTFWKTHGVKTMPTGRATPWPNRAETAVRLFKRQYEKLLMDASVHPSLNKVTLRDLIRECCWARNTTLTISGYTRVELATGRRPTDHSDLELMKPDQLSAVDLPRDATLNELRKLALKAHLEARQSADLRRDLARRVLPSDGPYAHGDRVFVWIDDTSLIRLPAVLVGTRLSTAMSVCMLMT